MFTFSQMKENSLAFQDTDTEVYFVSGVYSEQPQDPPPRQVVKASENVTLKLFTETRLISFLS